MDSHFPAVIAAGFAGGLLLILGVLVTGETFGQRCVREGNVWGSTEWKSCVEIYNSNR